LPESIVPITRANDKERSQIVGRAARKAGQLQARQRIGPTGARPLNGRPTEVSTRHMRVPVCPEMENLYLNAWASASARAVDLR
jgi:hypothetical protein